MYEVSIFAAKTTASTVLHGGFSKETLDAAEALRSFNDPVADSHTAAAFNLAFLTKSDRGLYVLLYFMVWVTSWWFALLSLLVGHIYFITNNITTGEYFSGHQRYWYVNKKKKGPRTRFTRPSVWENVCHRLFPRPEEECYSEDDIRALMSHPPQTFFEWIARKAAAVSSKLFKSPMSHMD
jgi:hypothetical protein